ncbi:proton-coupled zinc antiporter SLC30A1-like [Petromyzon marinus]|uniref:Zinc transporter 1-like n=1 Tax=Petromyzon marinus TaxID=7757 RepID=A0AAJ7WP23_PETMA|nr:zinc transporter 1-like [Petromyzon marinus]
MNPNRARLMCMLALTIAFFFVELVVSRITESLAMLSDSFHMLSDVIALCVALVAVKFAERTESTSKNTFGWIRAEVMGALVNAVFLTALCFTIVLEAIERFTEPRRVDQPLLVLGVGLGGLLINLIGLCIFRGHSHGHGHSHGGQAGHGHGHGKSNGWKKNSSEERANPGETSQFIQSVGAAEQGPRIIPDKDAMGDVKLACSEPLPHVNGNLQNGDMATGVDLEMAEESASQMNMRGVFLHVLGDALGSVVVVVNAILYHFFQDTCTSGEERSCWVYYLDPSLCLVIVFILLGTTFPLLRESALILLQTVPKHIDVRVLTERLRKIEGVLAVHELHVWQLAGSRIIATAHIKCQGPASYMETAKLIKAFFHNEGIHATTVQPEFADDGLSGSRMALCDLSCQTQCAPKLCCSTGKVIAGDWNGQQQSGPGNGNNLETIRETPEPSRESPAHCELKEGDEISIDIKPASAEDKVGTESESQM